MDRTFLVDVLVVGGGPAGLAAATYLLRNGKQALIIEKNILGGQVNEATIIQNYMGFKDIRGTDLVQQMVETLNRQSTNAVLYDEIISYRILKDASFNFEITTKNHHTIYCKYIIFATGLTHKKAGIPHEDELFEDGMLSYCATCDGPLFRNKDVAVLGGGNTAGQYALMLGQICNSVIMIDDTNLQYMEDTTRENIINASNITYFNNNIKSLKVNYAATGDKILIDDYWPVDGIFVAVGRIPNSEHIPISLAKTDIDGYLTSTHPNVFICGDCKKSKYHQIGLAIADGITAALDIVNRR